MHSSDPAATRKAVTQNDVARELGVSRTLVSFAMRGAPGVSEDMRQQILRTAGLLGYRRNVEAADLARKRPTAVGLHLMDLHNDVYADIFSGVQEALSGTGSRLVIGVNATPYRPGPGVLDPLLESKVGVVIAATLLDSDDHIRELNRTVPLVNVTRSVPGVDSIHSDDIRGSRLATEHLLRLGHRRIAHLCGPSFEGHLERRIGYRRTMLAHGRDPVFIEAPGFGRSDAAAVAVEALSAAPGERPTAVFAHSDELALGVREAAASLGLSVPGDLSLVGYDNSRVATLHGIELTSVDLHARELGRAAGQAALERIRYPALPAVDFTLSPTLVIRSSTAPPH
ncbi:LacI family transcriptional regulator [Arthrobacter sp. SW1]|uniref:LacI family DNA-binding transcriptional regulator n=1 Tax=Arthrobacter sp. SW1 TaxID=1920889 RepID=UPI000877BDFF|nr:LacI family DNA-binding transcriptional regulator [Arthrobacter sp. SW1]OFI37860.1 LacI family transcriptional regulator [Arthrobacter sp. SW1]